MQISTLDDRLQVLADNLLLAGYSKAQLVSIVKSFVTTFARPEDSLKLSQVAGVVEDAKALIMLTTDDVSKKMGAKDPTVRDLQTIRDMLTALIPSSTEAMVCIGVLGLDRKVLKVTEGYVLAEGETSVYVRRPNN